MATHRGVADCPVCLGGEDFEQWSALECGHVAHSLCLQQLAEYKQGKLECPCCRVRRETRGVTCGGP